MTVSVHNSSYLEPGYIFIAPYQEWQAGPYIYDKLGVRIDLSLISDPSDAQ